MRTRRALAACERLTLGGGDEYRRVRMAAPTSLPASDQEPERPALAPPRSLAARLALALALVALGMTAWRLQFGSVDLSDEAWYLAQPYRFALGDRPFVDEVHPTRPRRC